jgi:hypothetical protein
MSPRKQIDMGQLIPAQIGLALVTLLPFSGVYGKG